MMCRKAGMARGALFLLSLILVLCLTACTDRETQKNNISSPVAATDSDNRNPLQLVWLTVDYWVKDKMTEERLTAINQRIHELGYNFTVSFQGISDESYEIYQKGIDKAKKSKQGDLMWTGLGDGDAPEKEGTYYRQIRLNNLRPLDQWLETELGGKLKAKYSPMEWKRITRNNSIYGVRNIKEQGIFTSLILTGDNGKNNLLNGKNTVSLKELYQWLEEYRKNPDHKFYLDWNYVNDYNTSFSEFGYIKLCDGIYMTPEGDVENIWENEDVCKLWSCFAKMKSDGQLIYDESDELACVHEGKYPAAFVNITAESMDGSYLYQPDGTRVPMQSYTVAVPFLNRIENDVHGVTSWSQHPKEAMQLLTLVNTDEKLANLLYYGEEGKDYTLKGNKVSTDIFTDTYCPANPKITHISLHEAAGTDNKEKYYKEANKRYHLSPAAGFVPNLKKAGASVDLLNRVEFFYKTLLEGDEKPEEMIRKFQKKLKREKYDSILKNIQRQYVKWKKRRGKGEN